MDSNTKQPTEDCGAASPAQADNLPYKILRGPWHFMEKV
jgi:hypothetical protein